jgi:hypothetical protein
VFHKDLEKDIANELRGNLNSLFVTIASGSRSEAMSVDHMLSKKEAKELYDVIE